MFNSKSFLDYYSIPYWTEGRNVTPGWTNIQCPMCIDPSNHGGFSTTGQYNCWRCGAYALPEVISTLLQISAQQAKKVINEFQTEHQIHLALNQKKKQNNKKYIEIPGSEILSERHKKYLIRRKFDPTFIQKKYKILGTNHLSNYKFRIIVPIFYNGNIVSYQGRDITGKSDLRWKTCKQEDEIIQHKSILYNLDNCNNDWIIIVEGIFDVWRIGDNCCCTFGTTWTKKQVLEIQKRNYKKVFLFFDAEYDAQKKAEKLCIELSSLGIHSEIIETDYSDPDSIPNNKISEFLRNF